MGLYFIPYSESIEWNVFLTNVDWHADMDVQRTALVIVALHLNAKHRLVGKIASQWRLLGHLTVAKSS